MGRRKLSATFYCFCSRNVNCTLTLKGILLDSICVQLSCVSTGLCALSINNDNCYLAYPGSATIGEVQVFDTINLVRSLSGSGGGVAGRHAVAPLAQQHGFLCCSLEVAGQGWLSCLCLSSAHSELCLLAEPSKRGQLLCVLYSEWHCHGPASHRAPLLMLALVMMF